MGALVCGAPSLSARPVGLRWPNSLRTNSNTCSWMTLPAAVTTRWSGANQFPKRVQSDSRLNFFTASGVSSIYRVSDRLPRPEATRENVVKEILSIVQIHLDLFEDHLALFYDVF